MTNLNERKCAYCGKTYSLLYEDKRGYTYLLKTTHCSKSCASKNPVKINKGYIKPEITTETLKQQAIDFINEKGSYCTSEELCKGVGHSNKTFWKHGLKTKDLNAETGLNKSKSICKDDGGQGEGKNFAEDVHEKAFDGLVGAKGHPLRVDFYIPEINTVVEADGSQHSDPKHPWGKWNNGTVTQYDKIKDDFFSEKGIRLVRIPYKKKIKESDVLSRLD